jgi:hypothetical protein
VTRTDVQLKGWRRTRCPRQRRREPSLVRQSLSKTLIEVLGRESAEKIITELGGTRIWIPLRYTPGAKLAQLLGEAAAYTLCVRFGGEYLQIPNTVDGADMERRAAELHRQGCKINDIALTVGCSRRTVFRMLRRRITDLHRVEFARELEEPIGG